MHDEPDNAWADQRSTAPQPPPGLRSTLPTETLPPPRREARPAPAFQDLGNRSPGAQPPSFGDDGVNRGYGDHAAVQHSALQHASLDVDSGVDTEKRSRGVKNIVGGAVLIGIGFALGGSVFLGNPSALDWFFDGLGTLWILKGLYDVSTA